MKANPERQTEGLERAQSLPLPDPSRPIAQQDLEVLLALCLFGEARGESEAAQRAVAQIILNRARHPHRVFGSRPEAGWEENLRRVILRPRQFSCFNPEDPNAPKLLRPLEHESPAVWKRCLRCARQALAAQNEEDRLTGNSDHYFDESLQPPTWADPAKRTVKIGRLHFYRLYLPAPKAAVAAADPRPIKAAGRHHDRVLGEPEGNRPKRSPHSLLISGPAERVELPAPVVSGRPGPGACPPMSLPAPNHSTSRISGLPVCQWSLRSRRLSSLSLLALSLVLTACSDLERTAYQTLAVTQAEYATVERHAVEATLHGLMTDEQWDQFRAAAHRFIDAHNAAVDAFQLWSRTKSKSDTARLEALLEILPRLVREINHMVESFGPGKEPELPTQETPSNTSATEPWRHGGTAYTFICRAAIWRARAGIAGGSPLCLRGFLLGEPHWL